MDKNGPKRAAWLSRERRHTVGLGATVIRGERELPSRVSDLSLDGCCLSGYFRIGERLRIRIQGLGEFPAQIRWAMLGKAGARFIRRGEQAAPPLLNDHRGVATIEYALLAALIALSLLTGLTATGERVGGTLNTAGEAMPSAMKFER